MQKDNSLAFIKEGSMTEHLIIIIKSLSDRQVRLTKLHLTTQLHADLHTTETIVMYLIQKFLFYKSTTYRLITILHKYYPNFYHIYKIQNPPSYKNTTYNTIECIHK